MDGTCMGNDEQFSLDEANVLHMDVRWELACESEQSGCWQGSQRAGTLSIGRSLQGYVANSLPDAQTLSQTFSATVHLAGQVP